MPRRLSASPRRALSRALAMPRSKRARGGEDGQTLVEFALIFPIFVILVMGLIEFSLAFNAMLGVNRASENGVLVASEAGNSLGADCLVLKEVDDKLTTPNSDTAIVNVQVQWTNPSGGNVLAFNLWTRGGSTLCTLSDGTTMSVPYTATSTGYPDSQRCNVVSGCPGLSGTHNTVDTIGVQVRYAYTYKTPLSSLLTMIGGPVSGSPSWTFQKRNVMRIEPVL